VLAANVAAPFAMRDPLNPLFDDLRGLLEQLAAFHGPSGGCAADPPRRVPAELAPLASSRVMLASTPHAGCGAAMPGRTP
jgi:hypothetical protein